MTDTTTNKVLFDSGQFEVRGGASLPVALPDEVLWVDGYSVTHKGTGQLNGEFRALADAMLYALKWEQDMQTAEQGLMQRLSASEDRELN